MNMMLESWGRSCETETGMRCESGEGTYRVVIERGVDTTVSLDLVTCADTSAHPATAREGTLQCLEPVCIWAACFVVRGAEGFEGTDNEVVYLTVIIVLEETEEVKKNLSSGQIWGVKGGRYLRHYHRMVKSVICSKLDCHVR